MTKKQNTNLSAKRYLSEKNIFITIGALLILYLFALFNPLTGPWFQYPYYKIGCGKDPIVTSSIMGKSYYTPDTKAYKDNIQGASAIFCTEEEALKAGFQKSSAK